MIENQTSATWPDRSVLLIGLLILTASVALLMTPAAQAAKTHPFITKFRLPEVEVGPPQGMAVAEQSHRLYVAVAESQPDHLSHVDLFSEAGTAEGHLALPTEVHARYIAIDNTGGLDDGRVYVSGRAGSAGVVRSFESTGAITGVEIGASSLPPAGTPQGHGPDIVNNGAFTPVGISVGPEGGVFVGDSSNNVIDKFSPDGTFVEQLGSEALPAYAVTGGLAVSPSGNIYTVGAGNLFGLTSTGACLNSCESLLGPASHLGQVAIEVEQVTSDSAGSLLVSARNGGIYEYNAAFQLESVSAPEQLAEPAGVSVSNSTGKIFVGSGPAFHATVTVLGPTVIIPNASTNAATGVNSSGAVLHGSVGADGGPPVTGCTFQIAPDRVFREEGFAGATEVACAPPGPFVGTTDEAVTALAQDLDGGTLYHFRLKASSANGVTAGVTEPFVTRGPTVVSQSATNISGSGLTFEGVINPVFEPTTYQFEYVTRAEYEASGFLGAVRLPAAVAPVPGPSAISGRGDLTRGTDGVTSPEGDFAVGDILESGALPPHTEVVSVAENALGLSAFATETISGAQFTASPPSVVTQHVSALAPDTAYVFRLMAENGQGTTHGRAQQVSTFSEPSGGLPDGRAYEQVTPIDKNGSNVNIETNTTQAAADGEGVTFFSDGGLSGGEGATGFPTYLAERAADGGSWTTQGLLPAATSGPAGSVLGWSGDLTESFSENTRPGAETTLYSRSSSNHAMTQIAVGGHKGGASNVYRIAGTSTKGDVVYFEQGQSQLAPGAAASAPNAYIWNRETGRLVLAGMMNTGRAPNKGTFAGPFGWFQPGMSMAGRANSSPEYYYTGPENALSSDGSRVFFTAAGSGRLYMRVNPSEQQSALRGSECTEPAKACTTEISSPMPGVNDPNGPQPAAFVGASDSGQMSFFLSAGKLTSDATTGVEDTGTDLYRYDAGTGQLTDISSDPGAADGAEVQGVLGVSADGSTVYFAANGVLTEAANSNGERPARGSCEITLLVGTCNVYYWHAGAVGFVARVSPRARVAGGVGESGSDAIDWLPLTHPIQAGQNSVEATARVSEDGGTLLFRSARQLSGYVNEGVPELYRYRLGDGTVVCVSCSPVGASPTGMPALQGTAELFASPKLPYGVLSRNLSTNGNRIVFESPDRLAAGDTNDVSDVYEWEAADEGSCTGTTQDGGCLFLISPGTGSEPARLADADEEGRNVFFSTAQPLVAQDRDELADVYDARVGGGIASQNSLPGRACEGEAECLGPLAPAPRSVSPGTMAPTETGNVKRRHCRRNQRMATRHGVQRCVKKAHRRRHRHKRRHHAHHGKGHPSKGAK